MNDLDLLEKFRADAPPADPAVLARARAGMFREASRPRALRRFLVPAVAAAVAAVAASVVVMAVHAPRPDPEAVRVLRMAAAEARRAPVLEARPDQFVYVRSRAAWGGVRQSAESGAATYDPPVERDRRIWLSVDGSRDGLLRERGEKDTPLPEASPGYPTGLPTESTAMRNWLYRNSNGGNPADEQAFITVGDTLREAYVAPSSRAAMFEAAATIPDTRVVRQADLAGRPGVAVSYTDDDGIRHDLIFDAGNYRFLGERQVATTGDTPPYPQGAVIGWTAQLEVAIVDQVGQLP